MRKLEGDGNNEVAIGFGSIEDTFAVGKLEVGI